MSFLLNLEFLALKWVLTLCVFLFCIKDTLLSLLTGSVCSCGGHCSVLLPVGDLPFARPNHCSDRQAEDSSGSSITNNNLLHSWMG